jgi:hypothetical protein
MPRPKVYKLFHTYENEDLKIYFKTTFSDSHLVKLIKIWQMKLADIVPEYDWGTEEMMELLETFGCKRISESDGFKSYWEANMYLIWEYANTWYTDEECADPVFNNPEADKILQKVIQQNREVYADVWEKWEEEARTDRKVREEAV